MEAPEKIYLFENPISGHPDDRWLSSRSGEDDVEYTRTDTLEVPEVNLDKMLTEFMSKYAYENGGEYPSAIDIANRFFELGLNAQKGE